MKSKVNVDWVNGLTFKSELNGHKLVMDSDSNSGGSDLGPRPKALVLAALGGCGGMDIVSILKKMKQEIISFRMEIEADVSEEHPKVYTDILIKYIFKGNNLELEKLQKAIDLSQQKYCSVSAMLKASVRINYSITIE